MRRILFVDDEQKILDGLRRMLRRQKSEWEMVFVDRGKKALEELAAKHFDVIVSDMRMPEMDGATLLEKVQEEFPGTVRIVLSGHTEMEAALRAVPVAHQFLTKPCESRVIKEVVERACALQTLLTDEKLKEALGKIETLPALPKVYNSLTSALVDPEVSVEKIAAIVEKDAGITVKILQLVNSSFFSLAKEISDIQQAISYLGMNMLRNLTLSMEIFRAFENCGSMGDLDAEGEMVHGTLTGKIAQKLVGDKDLAEQAFMAGMLHDIGYLTLGSQLPEIMRKIKSHPKNGSVANYLIECEILGVSHAEVGGYLLGIWGMPYPIVEAVANHHHPSRFRHESFDVLGAVHVANFLANEASGELHGKRRGAPAPLDMDYLETMDVAGFLPEWREMAAEMARVQMECGT